MTYDAPGAAGTRQGAAGVSRGDDAAGQGTMVIGHHTTRVYACVSMEYCMLVSWVLFAVSMAAMRGTDSNAETHVLTYVGMTWRDVANTLHQKKATGIIIHNYV